MSHEILGQIEVKDLEAFAAAISELGGTFHQNKRSYTMYKGELPCDHAASFPNVRYGIGLRKREKSPAYDPVYDPFGYDGSNHDGHKIVEKCGKDLNRLKQHYGLHVAERAARKKGHTTRRKQRANGTIQLIIGG
mgnify:CR=1 FL=1